MTEKAEKIVRVVTVTGADDSIRPEELISIAKDYPFVEFGILLSKKQQGNKRFPSRNWWEELYILWRKNKLALSGHLCGEWVRKLCLGIPSFFEEFGYTRKMFSRFQLNFHAEHHPVDDKKLSDLIRQYHCYKPIIFQMDGVNEKIFYSLDARWEITAFPLFDQSGGNGLLPGEWPKQPPNQYCGYAGGLSPDNLQQEMERISKVAPGPIWIDAETLLRSEDDKVFNLEKVRRFLEAAKPWVKS
ncbi:MAG: hypothetical protein A3J72_03120 [Nitrospirae bacterium RIFCSPHIGHO2_02_FULL_40_19]|nr:MAG: hypothetical protein A3J72_03120 [Nitrospirae bacterium RIFCSPHIGHO2_02_FULL_40_19]